MLFVCLLHVLIVCGKVPTLTIGYQATVSHSPQAISVRSCPASNFYFHPVSCYFVSNIFLHLLHGLPPFFFTPLLLLYFQGLLSLFRI